ncbi:MAG: GNAT family N-acetyltransferase [Gammaproteobacteria bacterium]|nr:GNAT family N-acetyltransferase [Gammaproteobacteria bacterium]
MAQVPCIPDFSDAMDVDGTHVTIRPIEPADRERESAFVRKLSQASRYYRFHSSMKELTPALLERFTECHYPDDLALVAMVDSASGPEQIGVARYIREPGTDSAEIAIVVADAWQGKGIATRLLHDLRDLARSGGIHKLYASVLRENGRMLDLCRKLGFSLERVASEPRTSQLGKQLPPLAEDSQ